MRTQQIYTCSARTTADVIHNYQHENVNTTMNETMKAPSIEAFRGFEE